MRVARFVGNVDANEIFASNQDSKGTIKGKCDDVVIVVAAGVVARSGVVVDDVTALVAVAEDESTDNKSLKINASTSFDCINSVSGIDLCIVRCDECGNGHQARELFGRLGAIEGFK